MNDSLTIPCTVRIRSLAGSLAVVYRYAQHTIVVIKPSSVEWARLKSNEKRKTFLKYY